MTRFSPSPCSAWEIFCTWKRKDGALQWVVILYKYRIIWTKQSRLTYSETRCVFFSCDFHLNDESRWVYLILQSHMMDFLKLTSLLGEVHPPKINIDTKNDGPWTMYLRLQTWRHFRELAMLGFRRSIQHVASTEVSALCQVLLMLNALLAVWYIDQNEEANHLVTRKSIVSQGRPGGV